MVKENDKKNNPMRTYIFVLIFLTASVVQAAAPLTATYQAYAMGLNLLEATMEVSEAPETYTIQTATQTKGLLGLFMDSRQRFFTQGRKDSFTPVYSMMTRKGNERIIDYLESVTLSDLSGTKTVTAAQNQRTGHIGMYAKTAK